MRKINAIKAVVMDMDGVIIDSQPFWQRAQLEVLPALGVPLTRQDTIDTTGMRIDQIVRDCFAASPWKGVSCAEVCQRIVNRVMELVLEFRPAMPGLWHAIDTCRQQGLALALASSSPMSLIRATIDALELQDVFQIKVSGESLIHAKPHPEIYLNACELLGFEPGQCVAIEDSFVGLLAAKAAQMKTIVIPEPVVAGQKGFAIADYQLTSLGELTPEILLSF